MFFRQRRRIWSSSSKNFTAHIFPITLLGEKKRKNKLWSGRLWMVPNFTEYLFQCKTQCKKKKTERDEKVNCVQTFHWWQLKNKTQLSDTEKVKRTKEWLGGHEKLKERQIRNWCQATHFNCGTACQTLTQSQGHSENDQRAFGGHWALGCSNFLQKSS